VVDDIKRQWDEKRKALIDMINPISHVLLSLSLTAENGNVVTGELSHRSKLPNGFVDMSR